MTCFKCELHGSDLTATPPSLFSLGHTTSYPRAIVCTMHYDYLPGSVDALFASQLQGSSCASLVVAPLDVSPGPGSSSSGGEWWALSGRQERVPAAAQPWQFLVQLPCFQHAQQTPCSTWPQHLNQNWLSTPCSQHRSLLILVEPSLLVAICPPTDIIAPLRHYSRRRRWHPSLDRDIAANQNQPASHWLVQSSSNSGSHLFLVLARHQPRHSDLDTFEVLHVPTFVQTIT